MTPSDPTLGLVEAKGPRQKKPRAALMAAGQEHEASRPAAGQARVDGGTPEKAWDAYKDRAADHAEKSQKWKDAQAKRDVRLDDLVKVHGHKPFDDASAARVAREASKAVAAEKKALEVKQESKKALDDAWGTVRSFADDEPVRPLVPDESEESES